MLAIYGGTPVRKTPFPPWPRFADDEVEAVVSVLRSGQVNFWTGRECRRFEDSFAAAMACSHGIALANGTLALELALHAVGIAPGDDVIVPARTFIASASCVVARGARPVIADVDPDSGNITARTVSAALTPRTRAVVVVHLGGWPCDMDALTALAAERDLILIEDCAQAHGATWRGRPVGSFGACSAFSFCQDKIITTGGEGGMLLTGDPELWTRAWRYKDHGKTTESLKLAAPVPEFRWLHDEFGSNYRMTEMQAAIGLRQLAKLDNWLFCRNRNYSILASSLADLPGLRVPVVPSHATHAGYRFYAYLVPGALATGWDRRKILEALWAEGIPCSVGSCGEIYRERAFVAAGLSPVRRMPIAAELAETSLALPVHPTLDSDDIGDLVKAFRKVMAAATIAGQ
jgi:dTDP-4-amino-4,6-dideoxygalactose transaminase